jgi:hypothetical protein
MPRSGQLVWGVETSPPLRCLAGSRYALPVGDGVDGPRRPRIILGLHRQVDGAGGEGERSSGPARGAAGPWQMGDEPGLLRVRGVLPGQL